jgi:hypothetical protein
MPQMGKDIREAKKEARLGALFGHDGLGNGGGGVLFKWRRG